MINDQQDSGLPLPAMTAMTQTVTQRHLDECARAIGRSLWDFEVKVLDEILTVQEKVNRKLAKRGQIAKTHSLDEVVSLFVQRVQSKAARELTDQIMGDQPDKAKIEAQLRDIANDHR